MAQFRSLRDLIHGRIGSGCAGISAPFMIFDKEQGFAEKFLHWILCKGRWRREFGHLGGPFRRVCGAGGPLYGFCKEVLCFPGFSEIKVRQVPCVQWFASRILMALGLVTIAWFVSRGAWSVQTNVQAGLVRVS